MLLSKFFEESHSEEWKLTCLEKDVYIQEWDFTLLEWDLKVKKYVAIN